MPIARWALEKRVIYFPIPTSPDIALVKSESSHIIALLDEGIPPVAIIIRVHENIKIPGSILNIQNAITWPQHPHVGPIIMYGNNRMFRFVGKVLAGLTRLNVAFVDTLPQVVAVLHEQLPDLNFDALDFDV